MNVLRTKRSLCCLFFLVLFFSVLVSLPVLAEGDGSGGGQNVPLGLAASTPANGAKNVSPDAKIKLTFNKNVVNMTVKDNNQRCFSLYSNNQPVPIDVQMPDDQMYPELKREVTLVPRQGLKPGTSNTVIILADLQAKSGAVLGQDVKISFSTAPTTDEGKKGVTPPLPTDKDSSVKSPTIINNSANDKQAGQVASAEDNTSRKWDWNLFIVILAALMLSGGYLYIKRKK